MPYTLITYHAILLRSHSMSGMFRLCSVLVPSTIESNWNDLFHISSDNVDGRTIWHATLHTRPFELVAPANQWSCLLWLRHLIFGYYWLFVIHIGYDIITSLLGLNSCKLPFCHIWVLAVDLLSGLLHHFCLTHWHRNHFIIVVVILICIVGMINITSLHRPGKCHKKLQLWADLIFLCILVSDVIFVADTADITVDKKNDKYHVSWCQMGWWQRPAVTSASMASVQVCAINK